MIVLRGDNIRMHMPCALAMGKFESIHLGHRALINETVRLAKTTGLVKTMKPEQDCSYSDVGSAVTYTSGTASDVCSFPSALIVFEPHPYRVLSDPGYKPLFTTNERAHVLEGLGVDYLLEYPFDIGLAALPPSDFCHKLFKELSAKIIVVGEGYRFGHKRQGTADVLRHYANEYNATVHVITPRLAGNNVNPSDSPHDNQKISTSAIRALLSMSKLAEAESLLGYPFFIMGQTTPGRQLGRTIGFPTINLYPSDEKFLPPDGVYATSTIMDGRPYKGVTNVGKRPTVAEEDAPHSVETHLLDYSGGGELYGKHIKTEFLHFIRPEKRFENLEALSAQILADCEICRTIL